jgi:hypothetical protein
VAARDFVPDATNLSRRHRALAIDDFIELIPFRYPRINPDAPRTSSDRHVRAWISSIIPQMRGHYARSAASVDINRARASRVLQSTRARARCNIVGVI